jgi:monoamine oxidase
MNTRHKLSRRRFIAGSSIGAGALVTGACDSAGAEERKISVDVAVVGAGLAGLSAASEVMKAGRTVHVLEADNRVGGRILSDRSKGGVSIDWGAHFVGPQQTRILALANELGVPTYPTFNTGSSVQFFEGVRKTYENGIPNASGEVISEFIGTISTLDSMAASLNPAEPWTAKDAVEWDSQTFWSWTRANTSQPLTRALLNVFAQAVLSVESRDVSLLYVLFYIRSAGSLLTLISTAGGAQDSQFEAAQSVPEGLAKKIGDDKITLGSPVRRIVTADGQCTVHSDGVTVVARSVIVAVPPPMIPRIEFDPPLSARKDQLYQRLPMGSVWKAIAIYDTPFWRADNLNGQATSDRGPVSATFDVSPPSGNPGVMMGFVEGQDGRDFGLRTIDERRALVLDQFALWFGDKARSPVEYLDFQWDAQPLHRGCPVAVPGPGAIVGFRETLRQSEGAIHFASTETALEWSGYMDGAIQAGQLTAAEVIQKL